MNRQPIPSVGAAVMLALPIVLVLVDGWVPTVVRAVGGVLPALRVVPYLVLGVVAVTALTVNQTRIAFTALFLASAYLLLTTESVRGALGLNREEVCQALVFSLPVTFPLLFAAGESRLVGGRSLLRVTLAVAPTALVLAALRFGPAPVRTALDWQLPVTVPRWPLPHGALVLAGAAVLSLLFVRTADIRFGYRVLVASLAPFYVMLHWGLQAAVPGATFTVIAGATFGAVSVALLYAVYLLYWNKIYLDELTGVPNRRAFNERLRSLGRQYAVAMVDIDHFKKFNDTYGHAQGDDVLRFVAKHLQRGSGGRAFRYGGEEFALVFKGAEARDIIDLVDEMRERLANTDFHLRATRRPKGRAGSRRRGDATGKKRRVRVTISVGLAARGPRLKTPEEVVGSADKALYRAKKNGRNRVAAA